MHVYKKVSAFLCRLVISIVHRLRGALDRILSIDDGICPFLFFFFKELLAICRRTTRPSQITATCSIIPMNKSWIEVIYQSYKYLLAARKLNLFLPCFFLGNNLAGLKIFFFKSQCRYKAFIFFTEFRWLIVSDDLIKRAFDLRLIHNIRVCVGKYFIKIKIAPLGFGFIKFLLHRDCMECRKKVHSQIDFLVAYRPVFETELSRSRIHMPAATLWNRGNLRCSIQTQVRRSTQKRMNINDWYNQYMRYHNALSF